MSRKNLVVLVGNNYEITEAGKDVIKKFVKIPEPEEVAKTPKPTTTYVNVTDLVEDLKKILIKYTGEPQAYAFGGVMPFICTVRDLEETLLMFKRKYKKTWNPEKITKLILEHAEGCCKKKSFNPTIKNFVYSPSKGSPLGALMEVGKATNPDVDDFKIVETKNLFE